MPPTPLHPLCPPHPLVKAPQRPLLPSPPPPPPPLHSTPHPPFGQVHRGLLPPEYRTRLCASLEGGRCPLGARCSHAHSLQDLRVETAVKVTSLQTRKAAGRHALDSTDSVNQGSGVSQQPRRLAMAASCKAGHGAVRASPRKTTAGGSSSQCCRGRWRSSGSCIPCSACCAPAAVAAAEAAAVLIQDALLQGVCQPRWERALLEMSTSCSLLYIS